MVIGSVEFARRAGISERRVQQLIERGQIRALRVASRWVIDESELLRRRAVGRPMNPRMARALLEVLSGSPISGELDPSERSRLRKKINSLRDSENAPALIHSLLASRAKVHHLHISPRDLSSLYQEELIVPSGVSDPQNGISDSRYFEGYISEAHLEKIKKKYLLIESDEPNVVLRESLVGKINEIKKGLSLADLAEHSESRAEAKLREKLASL